MNFKIDTSLMNRDFRNCLAHYGLGQYMKETDIVKDDVLFGLTQKAFGENYFETKVILFEIMKQLAEHIEKIVLEK